MKLDMSKVCDLVNTNVAKVGDTVFYADSLELLRFRVERNLLMYSGKLVNILDDSFTRRYEVQNPETFQVPCYILVYPVEK